MLEEMWAVSEGGNSKKSSRQSSKRKVARGGWRQRRDNPELNVFSAFTFRMYSNNLEIMQSWWQA